MDRVDIQDLLVECKEHVNALESLARVSGEALRTIDPGLYNGQFVILESLENKLNKVMENM